MINCSIVLFTNCSIAVSRLALNGGSRIFSLPVLPFFPLLASIVSSHLLRDSLCTALQTWEERCRGTLLLPPLLLPFPDQLPLTALYRHAVEQVCDRRRNKWHRTGWLLARAGYVSPVAKSCVGICAFVLRCFFLFSHCTPKWSIVWGLHFFFLLPLLM